MGEGGSGEGNGRKGEVQGRREKLDLEQNASVAEPNMVNVINR